MKFLHADYLGNEGESPLDTDRDFPLHQIVALRRHNGGVDETQEDGAVHRVQAGLG